MKWKPYKPGDITEQGIYIFFLEYPSKTILLTYFCGYHFHTLPQVLSSIFDPDIENVKAYLQISRSVDDREELLEEPGLFDKVYRTLYKTGNLWEVAKARAAYDRGHSNFGKMLYENTEQIELMYEEAAEWYHKLKTMGVRTVTGPFEMKVNGTVIYSSNDSAL